MAYNPDHPKHILEPDLSARQKALAARALRRSPRIAVRCCWASETATACIAPARGPLALASSVRGQSHCDWRRD